MRVSCRESLRKEIQIDWQDSHISNFLTERKPCLLHELLRELDEFRSTCCIDCPHLDKESPPLDHGTKYCMDAPNSLYPIVHLLVNEPIHLISQHFNHSQESEIQSLKSSKLSRDFATAKFRTLHCVWSGKFIDCVVEENFGLSSCYLR
jgi:hypothetical protein